MHLQQVQYALLPVLLVHVSVCCTIRRNIRNDGHGSCASELAFATSTTAIETALFAAANAVERSGTTPSSGFRGARASSGLGSAPPTDNLLTYASTLAFRFIPTPACFFLAPAEAPVSPLEPAIAPLSPLGPAEAPALPVAPNGAGKLRRLVPLSPEGSFSSRVDGVHPRPTRARNWHPRQVRSRRSARTQSCWKMRCPRKPPQHQCVPEC